MEQEMSEIADGANAIASRSLPVAIRGAIDSLLEEYTRLEAFRANAVLQEATLKARLETMEREKVIEARVRSAMTARINVLENALKEKRETVVATGANDHDRALLVDPKQGRADVNAPGLNTSMADLSVADAGQIKAGRVAGGIDKYKTLPSNFLSRSAKSMSPGRRMLWKYLEELGYMPEAAAGVDDDANQGNAADRTSSSLLPPLSNGDSSSALPPLAPSTSAAIVRAPAATVASMSPAPTSASPPSPLFVFPSPIAAAGTAPSPAAAPTPPPPAPIVVVQHQPPPPQQQQRVPATARAESAESGGGNSEFPEDDTSAINEEEEDMDVSTRSAPRPLPAITPLLNSDAITEDRYSFDWSCTGPQDSLWKPKLTLLHHLDAVRSVCFHDQEAALLSGSEDGSVKLWNIHAERGARRAQPVHTYRGHTCMVAAVCMTGNTCVSASIDGKIITWNLPDLDTEDPYDAHASASKYRRSVLVGHTDVVWDLDLHGTILVSAGADGIVNVWNVAESGAYTTPKTSIQRSAGGIPAPGQACSSLSTMSTDRTKLLVSYTSGHLAQYDLHTGQCIHTFKQVGRLLKVVSHPNHALALCASIDNTILFCDVNAGTYVHRMLAHAQSVTSISVSSDGASMMSSCHDSSIRFWDIAKRSCVQDLSAHQTHRRKYGESIHSVAYHPTQGTWAASGGADCAVKVYQC